ALAASAPPHDEEDIAAADPEVEVTHDDVVPVRHREALHAYLDGTHLRHFQIPTTLQMTAKMPSVAMIQTIASTTADVAAWPTAAASRPHRIPRRHPASAISTPKTTLLPIPRPMLVN